MPEQRFGHGGGGAPIAENASERLRRGLTALASAVARASARRPVRAEERGHHG